MATGSIEQPLRFEEVYYVESSRDDIAISPIAIRPTLFGSRIEWGDTSRGTGRDFKQIQLIPGKDVSPEEIIFTSTKEEIITLRKLTLQVYNRDLKLYVAGKPEFTSDAALRNHYLNTHFG